jgi:hypothetical protein
MMLHTSRHQQPAQLPLRPEVPLRRLLLEVQNVQVLNRLVLGRRSALKCKCFFLQYFITASECIFLTALQYLQLQRPRDLDAAPAVPKPQLNLRQRLHPLRDLAIQTRTNSRHWSSLTETGNPSRSRSFGTMHRKLFKRLHIQTLAI